MYSYFRPGMGFLMVMLRYLPFAAVLAAPVLLPAATPSGQAPVQNGVISGVVVDGVTGEAVPEAVVFLAVVPARPVGAQTRQLTDEKGRFAFINLPGNLTYNVSVTKLGYIGGGYGRDAMPTDPLRAIPLKPDEWLPNVKVSIWKPGSISGIVRDETGEAVVGIVVRVLQRIRIQGRDEFVAGPNTRTDDHGAYRISGVMPGRYLLQVPSVQASVPTSLKLPTPDDSPVIARQTEELNLMDVDDSNRLSIGRYPVPPPPVNGRQFSYPGIFHPSTSAVADAPTIELKYGEDRTAVDFTLTPVASVRVSGVVEGPAESLESLTLRLLPAGLEHVGFGSEAAMARVSADGRFSFINVPAGSYVIDAPVRVSEFTSIQAQIGPRRALPGPPTTPVAGAQTTAIDLVPGANLISYNHRFSNTPYSARMPITVGNTNMTGVVVRLRPHVTVTGRIVPELDPQKPDAVPPARFAVQLDPATGDISLTFGAIGGRGVGGAPDFTLNNVVPGQYWMRLQAAPDWLVKSVSANGRDATHTPLDLTEPTSGIVVTVTNALPELSGTVRGTDDLKADTTMVIVFPTDPAMWTNTGLWPARMKTATVSSTSAFKFAPLPAGDYFIAAISRSFTEDWREQAFLTRVSRSAARVSLTWGNKSTVEVNAVVIK